MGMQFLRTAMLIGEEECTRLQKSHVAVFGLGGVGSYAVEALARSGVGELTIVDADTVTASNINRQLLALHSTMGKSKVQVAKERLLDINPQIKIHFHEVFVGEDNISDFNFSSFDYIVDAIDTVSAKILLVEQANAFSIPIIAAMGTGNKLDPTLFQVANIEDTSICPLCRVMRRELKKRNLSLRVVYSKEEPRNPLDVKGQEQEDQLITTKRQTPASISFVPGTAGLILAGEVIKAIACT